MGKHIKTQMDYDMIKDFALEIQNLCPKSKVLEKYSNMDNFEGAELRKILTKSKEN